MTARLMPLALTQGEITARRSQLCEAQGPQAPAQAGGRPSQTCESPAAGKGAPGSRNTFVGKGGSGVNSKCMAGNQKTR